MREAAQVTFTKSLVLDSSETAVPKRETGLRTFTKQSLVRGSSETDLQTNKKPKAIALGFLLVRETGLEPVRCEPHAPQTCASASSATLAYSNTFILLLEEGLRGGFAFIVSRTYGIIHYKNRFVNTFLKKISKKFQFFFGPLFFDKSALFFLQFY